MTFENVPLPMSATVTIKDANGNELFHFTPALNIMPDSHVELKFNMADLVLET